MLFAAPFLVAIVLLSLFLSPWAEQRKLEFERQLEQRDEVGVLAPGLFKEFKRAGLVVYVESLNPIDGRIRNVFLHSVDDAKDTTTVARLGHLEEKPNGDRFVVLENGSRYEGKPGTAEYQVIAFDKLGRRIEPAEARAIPATNKAMPTVGADIARRPQRARRTLLADFGADSRADPDAARDPACPT